ncbi:MAG: YitT family protein, partial [Traorella sp.]
MKDSIINLILILVGNFLVALGVTCFIVPNDILSGGIAGVSVALLPLFPHLDTTMFISVATVALFIIGSILLGKSFFIKTLISTICYPVILNILDLFLADMVFTDNQIIASIYTGILMGAGVGLVFRTGSSTGGMDIPALIMEKYLHIPLPTAVLIIDALTVLLGVSTYSINAALVGLISVYVSSIVIDKTISFGGQKTKSVMI